MLLDACRTAGYETIDITGADLLGDGLRNVRLSDRRQADDREQRSYRARLGSTACCRRFPLTRQQKRARSSTLSYGNDGASGRQLEVIEQGDSGSVAIDRPMGRALRRVESSPAVVRLQVPAWMPSSSTRRTASSSCSPTRPSELYEDYDWFVGKELEMNATTGDHRRRLAEATRTFRPSIQSVLRRPIRAKLLPLRSGRSSPTALAKTEPGRKPEEVDDLIRRQTGLGALTSEQFIWKTMGITAHGILINFGITARSGSGRHGDRLPTNI